MLQYHAQSDYPGTEVDSCFPYPSVVGVMKMGNSVPRAGIDPTSLASQASVLPLYHIDSLMSPLYPHLPAYAALTLVVSADY